MARWTRGLEADKPMSKKEWKRVKVNDRNNEIYDLEQTIKKTKKKLKKLKRKNND